MTEAGRPAPGSAEPAGLEQTGLMASPDGVASPASVASPDSEAGSPDSKGGSADGKAGRVRTWLRRTPEATTDVAPAAPSVIAAGPELDLASNDPLIPYLLSAASAVDITRLEMLSPALDALHG